MLKDVIQIMVGKPIDLKARIVLLGLAWVIDYA